MALALDEQQEAAVVDHQAETARALAWSPADPLFAPLEMRRGPAEGQQCHFAAIHLGYIAQVATPPMRLLCK